MYVYICINEIMHVYWNKKVKLILRNICSTDRNKQYLTEEQFNYLYEWFWDLALKGEDIAPLWWRLDSYVFLRFLRKNHLNEAWPRSSAHTALYSPKMLLLCSFPLAINIIFVSHVGRSNTIKCSYVLSSFDEQETHLQIQIVAWIHG